MVRRDVRQPTNGRRKSTGIRVRAEGMHRNGGSMPGLYKGRHLSND